MVELEEHIHQVLKDGGYGDHIFGLPIHGVGIKLEEAPLLLGHAFFHGEKAPPPLPENAVISVGNCGLYAGPWGVRVEDMNRVKTDGFETFTDFERVLVNKFLKRKRSQALFVDIIDFPPITVGGHSLLIARRRLF